MRRPVKGKMSERMRQQIMQANKMRKLEAKLASEQNPAMKAAEEAYAEDKKSNQ